VLAHEFGPNVPVALDSDVMLSVRQFYHGPADALERVKNARIHAGVHFLTACEVGTELGIAVANYVIQNRFQTID
jgi:hypothetical protein